MKKSGQRAPQASTDRRREKAAWIQYKLKLRGVSQADIARKLTPPVTPQMVGHVVLGKRKTRRIREQIAAALGLGVEQVWGEESGQGSGVSKNPQQNQGQRA